jgi:hypothetical protein
LAVSLTVSKTLGGSAVADTLNGAGTGVDLGSVVNAEYTPIILKSANTGWQALYIRHNATIDPITNVKTFIDTYSQTYGGASSAAADYATVKAKGNGSGNSANNADGLSSGLRIEHDADLGATLGASAFDATRAQVKIYGDNITDGTTLATGFIIHEDAMIHNNAGSPVDATTPVAGQIGKSGDTVLGNVALVKLRFYLESAAPDGGVIQWDWVISYSFTA